MNFVSLVFNYVIPERNVFENIDRCILIWQSKRRGQTHFL